jgi:hypothetical protein
MLQVFYVKWHSRLPKGESSKGCGIAAEHRGSHFIPRRSEEQQEIEMLKETLRQRDEKMRQRDEEQRQRDEVQRQQYDAVRQWDDFYAHAFAQQQVILQVSWLNYFILYWALSNTFKTNSLYCNMYSKWHNSKEFRCRSSNLFHHYLSSDRLLELQYVNYH